MPQFFKRFRNSLIQNVLGNALIDCFLQIPDLLLPPLLVKNDNCHHPILIAPIDESLPISKTGFIGATPFSYTMNHLPRLGLKQIKTYILTPHKRA